jgi:hypothetical protein
MKKLLYPLLLLPIAIGTLLSCGSKQKPKSEAELKAIYLQNALKSDAYKNAFMNVKRVNDALDSVKKEKLDTIVPIFEYNNSIATTTAQLKTVAQVAEAMKNDTAYLKAVQLKAAADSALADKRNIDFSK